MEKIQEHSLRIVYNDFTSPYSELLLKSGMPNLYVSRLRQLVLQCMQVHESLLSPSVPNYIKFPFEAKGSTYTPGTIHHV